MRAPTTWFWCLALIVLLPAQAPPTRPDDAQAIRDLVARYEAARDARDPAALRALFTDDADQLVSSGEWRHGREDLVAGMLRSSAANPGGRTLRVEATRFVASDVALADARYEIAGTGGAATRRMWSTFVAVRTRDGWRLAAIRNMRPTP
jgi:uncharacterized protein (TIGR02246 family)